MDSRGSAFFTSKSNPIDGVAANFTASAFATVMLRSGIHHRPGRSRLHLCKEFRDLPPDFGAAGQTGPMASDQPNKLVAFVDRHDVMFRVCESTGVADAIDEKSLDVLLHFVQPGIILRDVAPG